MTKNILDGETLSLRWLAQYVLRFCTLPCSVHAKDDEDETVDFLMEKIREEVKMDSAYVYAWQGACTVEKQQEKMC